jgi:hypothetical protein
MFFLFSRTLSKKRGFYKFFFPFPRQKPPTLHKHNAQGPRSRKQPPHQTRQKRTAGSDNIYNMDGSRANGAGKAGRNLLPQPPRFSLRLHEDEDVSLSDGSLHVSDNVSVEEK